MTKQQRLSCRLNEHEALTPKYLINIFPWSSYFCGVSVRAPLPQDARRLLPGFRGAMDFRQTRKSETPIITLWPG